MQLVETILRPGRIAWLLPSQPSAQAASRTFQLATGRWGGRYDVILQHDVGQPLSEFAGSALALADPDYVVSVHKPLGTHDWSDELARLRIQPFQTGHLSNSFWGMADWEGVLRGRPTMLDGRRIRCRAAVSTKAGWRRIARQGLLHREDEDFEAVARDSDLPTALEAASEGLTQRPALGRWLLLGEGTLENACRFWTLRALGARVVWDSARALDSSQELTRVERLRIARTVVSAPELSNPELKSLFRAHGMRPTVAVEDLRAYVQTSWTGAAAYARQVQATAPHRERLHVSLPVPDTRGQTLSAAVLSVVEHRLRSPDPTSPDGVILDTDPVSQQLLAGASVALARVTREGFAFEHLITDSSLQSVPVIGFQEAVAAPLKAAGFEVELSDKGRFQTKALEQARGLRFLAWVLTQGDSRELLSIFDEHHLEGHRVRDSYRRSVTYDELWQRLEHRLRDGGRRVTAARRERARSWLAEWADELLDRDMLVGGFHLKCRECLLGDFYPLERVDVRFRCERCKATSVLPAHADRRLRLGELFDTLRRQHGDVVTLVLAWLRREARESFLYLPEVDLLAQGDRSVEADFAALVDGRLAIGEAKSTRSITKREIGKLAAAARHANASRLIFATLDEDPACGTPSCSGCAEDGEPHPDHVWNEGTRMHIREARSRLEAHGVSVVSLGGAELIEKPAQVLGELAGSARALGSGGR